MDGRSYIKFKEAESAAIAEAMERFLKNGGKIEKLANGFSNADYHVSAQVVHNRHAKQEIAKRKKQASNRTLFVRRAVTPASVQPGSVEARDDEDNDSEDAE